MSIYTENNPRKIREILMQFGKEHEEALGYDSGILNAHIMWDELGSDLTDSFLMQIYEAAGLIKPSCSIYRELSCIIEKNFNLKRDVVEVGGGIFPILGHQLSERQLKLGKGTVTVYDSRVWTNYPTKAKLEKRYFNSSATLSENSLLVGLFPCDATDIIFDRALKEDLEFCIALCGCNHSNNPFMEVSEYHQLLIEYLMEKLPSDKRLKIQFFPTRCFGNMHTGFPIVMAKNKPKVKLFTLPFKTR